MRRHITQGLSILLVCVSSMVFSGVASAADNTHQYTDNPIAKNFLKPQDYSLGYLKQMFGSMDGMIQSNTTGSLGGFIMGDIFSVLNSTVLIFALVLLMYIVFTATLKTAHDGEVMGRQWSSPWIMLRAAGAMVMLIPQKATGYCLAQKVVMMIVLLGVAGANAMWSAAVDKMLSKSTVHAIISQQADWGNGKLLTPIQAMYQQVVCRDTLRKNYGNGPVDIYGPFYSYNGRIPNVTYDTASYAIFTKKNISTWWYVLAGATVIAGTAGLVTGDPALLLATTAGGGGAAKIRMNNDSAQQQRTGVKPNDTNESRIAKPLCGGVWWTIPYYSVPVMQTSTTDGVGDTGDGTNVDVQLGTSDMQNIADIPLEQKIEQMVNDIYRNNFMYAGYNFRDEADETSGDIICGNADATTDVGRKYGCFTQSVQQYDDLISHAMRAAKEHLLPKVKHYSKHAYVIGPDGQKKYLKSDTDQSGVDLTRVIKNMKAMIKQQGWANAGSYFYNIAELTSAGYLSPIQLNVTPMYVTKNKSMKHLQDAQYSASQYLEYSYQRLNNYYTSDLFVKNNGSNADPTVMTNRQKWTMRVRSHIHFDTGDEQLAGNSRLLVDILSFGLANLARMWSSHLVNSLSNQAMIGAHNSGAGMVNPIITLQNLGKAQMDEVQNIWVNGLMTIEGITVGMAGVAAFPGASGIASSISQGVTSIINWLQSLMQPIAMMLFSSGFLLAVWLPFAPYVLALFCVFGWLIAVVEMMVAAPIIAVGILSPEGHELMGKGAPSVMLAMGIFLRPMLMILGFIASMIGIYIASDLVNAGFLHMVNSVFHNRLGMLTTVGLISLYAMVMTTLCNKSFGMMTVISDRVLRWIGGHNATFSNGEEQSVGEAKGAISSTGDKGAQTGDNFSKGTSVGKGLGSTAGAVRQKLDGSKSGNVT